MILQLFMAGAAHSDAWREGGSIGFAPGQATAIASADSGLRLVSFLGQNMALEAASVRSGNTSVTGSRSITDGQTGTEWRFQNRTDVLGQGLVLDLGGDRAIDRVRIVPGDVIEQRPLFFLKGYRIEIATALDPGGWILAAVQPHNSTPLVDTAADSTWQATDRGKPLAIVGRFVRLTITRTDPPNWVSIGEFEVYGRGFRESGHYESAVFDAGRPVDFSSVRFSGMSPPSTGLAIQVRTSIRSQDWVAWRDLPVWGLRDTSGLQMKGAEPARYAQYRAELSTNNPLTSPSLDWIEIGFDSLLAATRVTASIEPLRPPLGVQTRFTYRIDVDVSPQDIGFDRVEIDLPGVVDEIRWQEMVLPTSAYRADWDAQGLSVKLDPEWRVTEPGRMVIGFTGVLLRPTLDVWAAVGSQGQSNLLYAAEGPGGWTLRGVGVQGSVLGQQAVAIRPNPFNPLTGPVVIEIDVAKLEVPRPVSVHVLDVAGRRVVTLWDRREVTAGRHRVEWHGRVLGGRLTPPGIYLLKVSVDSNRRGHWLGTMAVAY